MATRRIVIVGGGFAGVECARRLRRALARNEWEIVLFNRENHMVFHPLLAEVAGASINPDAVAAPLRQMLPGVKHRTEEVERVFLGASEVEYAGDDGKLRRMGYDHIVLAVGSVVNLGMVPGMADHAFPLKTIGDAMALRAHVMHKLEQAEVCEDAERRKWYLSFVIVGGGFSGVETAGELNDLARESCRFFQNFCGDDVSVTLVHSREQILPEVTPTLREFARAKMERAGIRMALNARVALATSEGVGLKDGTMIRGATVVCTIGTTMPPVVERLDAPKEGGRLLTEPDMRLQGRQNAWATGDCARVMNAYDNQPSPTTAQFAVRQGKQVARNIVRAVRGEGTEPFRFKPLGQLCAIGGRRAVAELFGMKLSGFFAWFLWRTVYLMKMPSVARKIKVGLDWAWDLFFARDLAYVKTGTSERVSNAYYRPGDYVFHAGDPAGNFYVIEKGEVEILKAPGGDAPEEVVAVLGPGDFFGEMALMDHRPRSASVRARTAIEVVILGRDVFTQISGALKPLREIVVEAARRRGSEGVR